MHRLAVLLFLILLFGCAPRLPSPLPPRPSYPPVARKRPPTQRPYRINGRTYYPLPSARGYVEVGLASWYGPGFHGKRTASGERYNMYAFTAAHKLLPMNTYVLVTNLENGRQTIVRINDRGPFVKNRIIDLSYAAAKALGMTQKGVARVRIVALGEGRFRDHRFVFTHPPNLQKGQFFLQVGAFTNYANAVRLKEKLAKRFRCVLIEPYEKDGQTFFRVQIFLATDLNKARAKYAQLERLFPQAFIVAK